MLVLLFYELVKHRGDIKIYDAIQNLKDNFDWVKYVKDDCYVWAGAAAQGFSSFILPFAGGLLYSGSEDA